MKLIEFIKKVLYEIKVKEDDIDLIIQECHKGTLLKDHIDNIGLNGELDMSDTIKIKEIDLLTTLVTYGWLIMHYPEDSKMFYDKLGSIDI